MTRYARVKRDQKIQLKKATPWSLLAPKPSTSNCNCNSEQSNNNESDDSATEEIESKTESTLETVHENDNGILAASKLIIKGVENDRKSEEATAELLSVISGEAHTIGNEKKALLANGDIDDEQSAVDKSSEENSEPAAKAAKIEGTTAVNKQHLRKLLVRLLKVPELRNLKKDLNRLRESGEINRKEKLTLLRKWKNKHWRSQAQKKKSLTLEKLSSFDEGREQTMEDVKKMLNSYVKDKTITRFDAAYVIRNWKRREARRIKRQLKCKSSSCFYCRQTGHKFSDCPVKNETEMGTGICFKCGSTEHTSSRCTRKNVQGFPYASCFVCKKQGHLSRDCPDNPNGIFPEGGSCSLCGSEKHLRKDCPTRKPTKEAEGDGAFAVVTDEMVHGDDDVMDILAVKQKGNRSKSKKIVHF